MKITPAQYVEYIAAVAEMISQKGEYITALDAATGDGDHWLNINIGYRKLLEEKEALQAEPTFQSLFLKLAELIMSGMGGTSGALYGSAYMASARLLGASAEMNEVQLADMLACWETSIMKIGDTKPGFKTMVDTLHPAAQRFGAAVRGGSNGPEALETLKKAAWEGAESTKEMKAVRGRASNQPGKGVGHLDPGAVTMAMQMECLADYLAAHCI